MGRKLFSIGLVILAILELNDLPNYFYDKQKQKNDLAHPQKYVDTACNSHQDIKYINKVFSLLNHDKWKTINDLLRSILDVDPGNRPSFPDLFQLMDQLKETILSKSKILQNFSIEIYSLEDMMNISTKYCECFNMGIKLIIDLRWNKIGDKGAESVAAAISKLTQLTQFTIGLEQNNIGDNGAESVAAAISKLTQLTNLQLYISWNKIGDNGAESVAAAISKLTQLKQLTIGLDDNELKNPIKTRETLEKYFVHIKIRDIWV